MSSESDFDMNFSDARNVSEISSEVHIHTPEWAKYVRITYMLCVVLFGVPGNFLILILQFKNATKSSTDWFVIALATIDLGGASLSALFYVITTILGLKEIEHPAYLCQFHFYAIYTTSVTSAVLLCMIAIDRYIKACRPHSNLMTVSKAKWLSLVTVVTVLVLYLPSFWVYGFDEKTALCKERSELSRFELWLKVGMGFSFVLLCTIPIISYSKIAIVLRGMRLKRTYNFTQPHTKPLGHKAVKVNRAKVTPMPCGSKLELEEDLDQGKHSKNYRGILLPSRGLGYYEINANHKDIDLLSGGEIRNGIPKDEPDRVENNIAYNRGNEREPQTPQLFVKEAVLDAATNLKIPNRLEIKTRKAHVTTKIMFILTMFFLLTWFISVLSGTLVHISATNANFRIASYLLHPIYMINFVCNPILYFSLSTKFRSKLLQIFKRT